MRKFIVFVGLISLVTVAGNAYAGKAYSIGGCGLGSLIIKERGQWAQLGSSFLNNFFFPQTFAITSGTSNCHDREATTAMMEQEVYMTANFVSLSREAAQGSGEHLTGLAEVLGCEQGNFAQYSQKNYSTLFSGSEPKAVLENYRKELKGSCSRVI